jgi:hypothetical protein
VSWSEWLTLVLAVLGFLLALASLIWQVVSFIQSGSRVSVKTMFGMPIKDYSYGEIASDQLHFFDHEEAYERQHERALLVAVISNIGRQAATVTDVKWETPDQYAFAQIERDLIIKFPIPYRLEPNAQCYGVHWLPVAMWLLHKRYSRMENGSRRDIEKLPIRAIVTLANGRTVRGDWLALPKYEPHPDLNNVDPARDVGPQP